MRSALSSPRPGTALLALLAMVATLLPLQALPAVAAIPNIGIAGVPSLVEPGEILDLQVVDTSPGAATNDGSEIQFSIPANWALLGVDGDDGPVDVSVLDTDSTGGLNFPADGVLADRFTFRPPPGGSFITLPGEALVSVQVLVGPAIPGGPVEVVDATLFGEDELGGFASRNAFTSARVGEPTVPSIAFDGLPAEVAVGDLLDVQLVNTSTGSEPNVGTAIQLAIPDQWELVDAGAGVDVAQTVDGGELTGGLNFPRDGVLGDRFTLTPVGGEFRSSPGETIVDLLVRVGPAPVRPNTPTEVLDANIFGVDANGDGSSSSTFDEVAAILPTWSIDTSNVVSTGAVYPFAITNQSNQDAALPRVALEVPVGWDIVDGPPPTASDVLGTTGRVLLIWTFSDFNNVAPGEDGLFLNVVAPTPSLGNGNGALEFIDVDIFDGDSDSGYGLVQSDSVAPFVEHSVRIDGASSISQGTDSSFRAVDARGTITNGRFPNSTMGTLRVEIDLPAGVTYVPGSSNVSDSRIETSSDTLVVTGPFTTGPGDTLFTFDLSFDGSAPGVDVPIVLRSVPTDARAPEYDSTLPGVGPSKLQSIDLIEEPYLLEAVLPESVVPGETFTLRYRDGRDPTSVEQVTSGVRVLLPTGWTASDTSEPIAGTSGPSSFQFQFDDVVSPVANGTTLPGDELVSLDVVVPIDAEPGTETIRLEAADTGDFGDLAQTLLTDVVVEGAVVAPEVVLVAAARDPQAGTLDALGRLVGAPSTPYLLQFAGADGDGTTCTTTNAFATGVPVVTNAAGVVDFGTTLLGSDVAGPLPGRVTVAAVAELEVVELGDAGVGTAEVRRFEAGIDFASNCAYAGFGNGAWTAALDITRPVSGDVAEFDVADVIEQPGGATWYRFDVVPGARATIDLGQLPADYDLAVFTDIREEFTDLTTASPEDAINRLGAEFAPSAFSPSAFSPSAFSPSAFSPSAFSPSAFSPSAFSPSVYAPSAFSPSAFSPSAFSPSAFSPSAFSPSAFSPSAFSPSAFSPSAFSPSAFSPSAFSPSAFSPSAFSPSAFSPSAFSPSAFSPEAYAGAQQQALITVSANDGTADELAVVNTWDNDTQFYVRVAAKPDAADPAPFDLEVRLEGATCNPVTRIDGSEPVEPTGGHETVIVWDSGRLAGDAGDVAAVASRLDDLAAASDGIVFDLAGNTRVQALQAQADANAQCVYAANLVAAAIKQVVDSVRPNSPDLANVVVVGGDDVVPFFRYPDTALLGPESDYVPPVADTTRAQAQLRQNYVLGQDQYGASTILSLGGTRVPVPELAVGRLVETPAEIIGMVDQFLDPSSAQPTPRAPVEPTSTLVTGYDFMTDAAAAIQQQFVAGTSGAASPQVNDALVAPANQAPGDPLAWTAGDLFDAFLAPAQKHDLVYLAGHFSANSALAADYETALVTTQIAPSGVDLAGTIVFSNGCHSGYNIVDGEGIPGLTLGLDWAQAMAQQQATFVGGTGYQYGDTDLVEYSERLYANFARELRRGTGAVGVGEAMVRAKLDYLSSTPDPRGLHRKSLLIATVFGLPMTAVDLPGDRLVDDGPAGAVTPTPVVAGPGAALDLSSAALAITPELSERLVQLDVVEADGTPSPGPVGSYLVGPTGRTAVQPNEPILPLVTTDVTVDGTSLRGVAFRGGTYVDESGVTPLTSAAGTELRGVHVPFASEVLFPMQFATANYYGAVDGGRTGLLTTPVQHVVERVGDETATRRVYDLVDLELFYSSNTETYTGVDEFGDPFTRTPALSAPPQLEGLRFSRVLDDAGEPTDDVRVEALVIGDPAAGIQQVWVTTTSGPDASGAGEWLAVDLVNDAADTRRWSAVLPGAAAPGASQLDVVLHAVNGVGLVSTDDNLGRYYRTAGGATLPPGVEPPAPSPTVLTLDVPLDAPVGSDVDITVTLTDATGAGIAGQPVLVQIGSGGRTVVTGPDGSATATFAAAGAVGSVGVTATYRGDQAALAAPSTASVELTVVPIASTVEGVLRGDGSVAFVLRGGTPARRLAEQGLRIDQLAADGSVLVSSSDITRFDGGVLLPAAAIDPATTSVVAVFAGTQTVLASASAPVSVALAPATPEDLAFPDDRGVKPFGRTSRAVFRLPSLGGVDRAELELVRRDDGSSATSTLTLDDFGPAPMGGGLFEATVPASSVLVGVYDVRLRVLDDDVLDDGEPASSAYSEVVELVVFDPYAGSAAGVGLLRLPEAGTAPLPEHEAGERSSFAFSVRYGRRSGDTPRGGAVFSYRRGDFSLLSTDLDWLVVSSSEVATFRGEGWVTRRVDGRWDSERLTFSISLRDGNRWGGRGDEFGLTVYDDDGSIVYRVARTPIDFGSIRIRSR